MYHLVGKAYTKSNVNTQRTVNNLDFENLYLNVSEKIIDLAFLIKTFETFLEPVS